MTSENGVARGRGNFLRQNGCAADIRYVRYDGQRLLQYVVTNPDIPIHGTTVRRAQASPSSVVRLAPDVRIPYLMQFGIGVERQLQKIDHD